jgi:hypothetical protein
MSMGLITPERVFAAFQGIQSFQTVSVRQVQNAALMAEPTIQSN